MQDAFCGKDTHHDIASLECKLHRGPNSVQNSTARTHGVLAEAMQRQIHATQVIGNWRLPYFRPQKLDVSRAVQAMG